MPTACLQVVERKVAGNGVDPGGQRGIRPKVGHGPHDADEGFLENIFRRVALPDEPEDEVDEGLLQLLHEGAVRRGVPLGTAADQLLVEPHRPPFFVHFISPF